MLGELKPIEPKPSGDPKFDYEKVKTLYNASLLDTELHDPMAFLLKKK